MEAQAELGIDVITDGEVDRGAYYIHIMNNIQVYFNLPMVIPTYIRNTCMREKV